MKPSQPTGWRVAPVFLVQSVERSIPYYRDRLGFQVLGPFGQPVEMAFVGREGIQFMLQDGEGRPLPGSNRSYKSVAWDAHIWVDDVEALRAQLKSRGATILKPPTVAFYRNREIEVGTRTDSCSASDNSRDERSSPQTPGEGEKQQ